MADTSKEVERFLDWGNLVLAACLFIAPWVLNFVDQTTAAWSAWIAAVVIGGMAVLALIWFAEWEEWINVVLGVWVAIAPWVLGFYAVTAATWSHVILGVLIAALAAWRGWTAHYGGKQAHA